MWNYLKHLPFISMLFWIAFLTALGFTVPDVGYVLASTQAPDWRGPVIGYSFATLIEGIVFFLTLTTFRLKKEQKTLGKRVPYYIVVGALSLLSCYLLTIYTHHFYRPTVLKGAEDVPFYHYLPYVGAIFPALTILFAVMSETLGTDLKKDELTLDAIKQANQRRIDLAKEQKRVKDEMAKYETNPLTIAIQKTGESLREARHQADLLKKQQTEIKKNKKTGKQESPTGTPNNPTPAPVQPPTEESVPVGASEAIPEKVDMNVTGKLPVPKIRNMKEGEVLVGNVPYWSKPRYEKFLKEHYPDLKATQSKLDTMVNDPEFPRSFSFVEPYGKLLVIMIRANDTGQRRVLEYLQQSRTQQKIKLVSLSNQNPAQTTPIQPKIQAK